MLINITVFCVFLESVRLASQEIEQYKAHIAELEMTGELYLHGGFISEPIMRKKINFKRSLVFFATHRMQSLLGCAHKVLILR